MSSKAAEAEADVAVAEPEEKQKPKPNNYCKPPKNLFRIIFHF